MFKVLHEKNKNTSIMFEDDVNEIQSLVVILIVFDYKFLAFLYST